MKRQLLVLAMVFLIVSVSVVVVTAKAQTPGATVNITLYGGPVTSGTAIYGFGYTADNITSPGPTITLHDGDTVTVTFHNVDPALPHSFAVTTGKNDTAPVLFNSETNPGTYVQPGTSATVTFTVSDNIGNNYYICKVPGHVDLGMWGNCVIEAAIPEFPSTLLFIFVAIALTTFAVYLKQTKMKPRRDK